MGLGIEGVAVAGGPKFVARIGPAKMAMRLAECLLESLRARSGTNVAGAGVIGLFQSIFLECIRRQS